MSSAEYRGHTIEVRRVDAKGHGYRNGYEYEFELLVDGEFILTASDLEGRDRWESEPPWVHRLLRYGEAYVDGLEADL